MQPIKIYRLDATHPQSRVCAACDVRSAALFGALDDAGLDLIHVDIAQVTIPAEAPAYARGDRGSAVFTIRSGIVRFERTTEDGDRRIVRLAGRGDLIGQEALIQRPFGDDAIASTVVEMCRIPRAMVERLGAEKPVLLQELMRRWQRALDEAEGWIADLAMGTARRRMLGLLVRLSHWASADGTIWVPPRDQIGAMLDLRIETASRLVSALRREGVLQPQGLYAARIDPVALQRALDDSAT